MSDLDPAIQEIKDIKRAIFILSQVVVVDSMAGFQKSKELEEFKDIMRKWGFKGDEDG